MPEIGECYSIAKKLGANIGNISKIETSDQFEKYILKGEYHPDDISGGRIVRIIPYGKSLWILGEIKKKKFIITSQLGMTGSWFIDDAMAERGHFHLNLRVNKRWLKYSDPRMFGKMNIYIGESHQEMTPLIIKKHKWGIDPIQSSELEILAKLLKLKKSEQVIKSKLLEQNLIFGIGNYLASEILFDAKISPNRKCSSLSDHDFKKITHSIKKWVTLAERHNGFSFAGGYIMPDGTWGDLGPHIKVYQKEGSLCLVCKNKIGKTFVSGRATFFCKICQK